MLRLLRLLLLPSLAWALHDTAVSSFLREKIGLTRREADLVQYRHRKVAGTTLRLAELKQTVGELPSTLLPGQLAELLRSSSVPKLRTIASAAAPGVRWCSYKKTLCDCGATMAQADEPPEAPEVLAIDCEFKPLRCAAVSSSGRVVFDCLVTPDVAPAGRSSAPLPSILRCDRPRLIAATAGSIRERLRKMLKAGSTIVAHTPQSDLRALGFDPDEHQLQLPAGVVDVATVNLQEGEQVASLKRLAARHLGEGEAKHFQKGGAKHCAVQDALVTLKVYEALREQQRDAKPGPAQGDM